MTLAPPSRRARGPAVHALLLAATLSGSTLAEPARANGRYPASGQIAIHPADPKTLLVRATYGLMFSKNGGQGWGWLCEPAVGYGNVEDPMMAFTENGTLLAGIFEGLSVGTPDACQWSFVQGALLNKYVIDLSVDKVDPTKGVLIISNSVGQDDAGSPIFSTQLWQTSDNGATWAQAGVSLPPQFLGLTVDSAPSNPMRVYASGRNGPPSYPGVIERTDDRGATWQALSVPGADDTHLPYLGAVDPTNPDVVYVRIDSDPSDALMVSKDGGMTWSTPYKAVGKLNGFALSPDGSTVAIGGPMDGVSTAPTSTLEFTKQSSVGALCLTWAPSGLYACADEFVDHFTAGISADGGKTWQALMHLSDVCPLTCSDPDSGVSQLCPALWPSTAMTINATCDVNTGTGGGSGAGGSSSSSGGSPAPSKGCSCALPEQAGGGAAMLSLGGIAAALVRARRRPARPRR